MDTREFPQKIADGLAEASDVSNNYDLVVSFARIWYHKALLIVEGSISGKLWRKFFNGILEEGCRSLQNALSLKPEDPMLELVKQVPRLVGSHCTLSESDSDSVSDSDSEVSEILYKFLVQTMLLKVERLLSELLKAEVELLSPLKKQIGAFREGIILLIKSEMNQRKNEDADEGLEMVALRDIEPLTADAISLCKSCRADKITEEAVRNMESQLPGLLKKLQELKKSMKDLYFEELQALSGSGPIDSLLERFKNLHRRSHHSLALADHQITDIHDDLEYIMGKYSHIINDDSKHEVSSELVDHVHQVQRVMEEMKVGGDPTSQQLLSLYYLSEEIKIVGGKLPQINDSVINDGVINAASVAVLKTVPSRTSSSALQHETFIVGFDRERETIIDRLLRNTKGLQVVLISGMPGVGKTTLAQTVFHSPGIKCHFHVRLWCSVTLTCQKRDLWENILTEMGIKVDMLPEKDDQDLFRQVSDLLSHKRYLVVLDDVWDTSACQEFRKTFPDGANESRILMTSRLNYVASNPVQLHGLSDEESWKLLNMKVFGDKGCPEEMQDFGRKIVKSCKGLPSAIGALADDLVDKDKDQWQEISEVGSSKSLSDLIKKPDGFEQSYNQLQYKHCFRYLGVFPRDEDIPVRRLLWLLIAEGYVTVKLGKSLEDTAEACLKTLIDSSLVTAAKRGSNGKIKTCQVHGLLLDFCSLKAMEDNILEKISNASQSINATHRHLSICSDPEPFITARIQSSLVRSLLFFTSNEMYPGCDSDLSLISNSFKLLYVLDLESVNVGNSLVEGIDLPRELRYLGVAGDMDSLPPSLSELEELLTLVVKGLMNKFVMPAAIWKLEKLRHIHVSNHCLFTLQNEGGGSDPKLDNLVSLSMPSFSCVEETKRMFERLPNVRKLKCKLLEPRVGSNHTRQFPEFGLLEQLESLKLSYYGRPFYPLKWRLPSGLKELNLSNFRLPWDQMSDLMKKLPKLEILKLVSRAFEGTTWEMKEGEFKNLKYLKLDSLNIVHWNADDDQLPSLEQLVLRNCEQLQDVPSAFGGTTTMKKIEVHRCGVSVEEAVRKFVEEQIYDISTEKLICNIS